MSKSPDDELTILARLMPAVRRLQNDSRGLIQWLVTLNDQEWLALIHWAPRRAPWLRSAIQRIPRSTRAVPKPDPGERKVSA
jgi:hypothetical protein